MKIEIRKAVLSDMPEVYHLVHELAIYEKEPNALTSTVKEYEEAFAEKLMDVFVAVVDNRMIGIAVFYMTFSTWKGKCLYLEDFYVVPEYRKDGVGQQLFDTYMNEAKKLGAKQTKWQVLNWNVIALNFYKKNNAIIENDWYNGKIMIE